jgi:hypothetical protein
MLPLWYELGRCIPQYGILHSQLNENLKSYMSFRIQTTTISLIKVKLLLLNMETEGYS